MINIILITLVIAFADSCNSRILHLHVPVHTSTKEASIIFLAKITIYLQCNSYGPFVLSLILSENIITKQDYAFL